MFDSCSLNIMDNCPFYTCEVVFCFIIYPRRSPADLTTRNISNYITYDYTSTGGGYNNNVSWLSPPIKSLMVMQPELSLHSITASHPMYLIKKINAQ